MTHNPYTTPLHPAKYQPTERFIQMMADEQVGICFEDGGLVAIVGKSGDPESALYSLLFAAAPELFQALHSLVEALNDEFRPAFNSPGPMDDRERTLLERAEKAIHLANPTLYPESCQDCRQHSQPMTRVK